MIAVAALVVAGVACVVAAWALLRMRATEARFRTLWGDDGVGPKQVANELAAARAQLSDARRDAGRALKHVAVVRYDAFGDMAGQLSFSAALLDDSADGIVLSTIHGRGESRTYAKSVEAGVGSSDLTPEEQQAVAAARAGEQAQ